MSTSTKHGLKRAIQLSVGTILALVLLCLGAPLIHASRFRDLIASGLENSLGRRVTFSDARLMLFPSPGFSLTDVVIAEDPKFGLEPFAQAPTLKAKIRIDKLLVGRLQFSSVRLVEPSLNLVKQQGGDWNVVSLIQRFAKPSRLPMNLFPALEISDGRINFKLGVRKTVLYVADSDFAIYPAHSGKVYFQFSGSPARTDRAGNGFGSFRGSIAWDLKAAARHGNQIEADVTLNRSNLSELTTLIEGHDLGVHGTISSHVKLAGPATALGISGDLHLEDVHRWDLLPSSGEDWRIRYKGDVDLTENRLDIETAPWHATDATPVGVQVHVADFLTKPVWALFVRFNEAPAQDMLPLARRMGIALPSGLAVEGALNGAVGYSSEIGLNGSVTMTNVVAEVPNLPPLKTASATATLLNDRVHFAPTTIQTSSGGGVLEAGGDFFISPAKTLAVFDATDFPLNTLKQTLADWFGTVGPLNDLQKGEIAGHFVYSQQVEAPPVWSGQFQFSDSTISSPVLAVPLQNCSGRIGFDATAIDLTHFSTSIGLQTLRASYHYNALAKRPERVDFEVSQADIGQLEKIFDPMLSGQSLLARLGLTKRSLPGWLATRNMEGSFSVDRFSVQGTDLGPLRSHFLWQGANIQFRSLRLNLPEGIISGSGGLDVASYVPHARFNAKVTGFSWGGGLLSADGEFETSGTGSDTLRNLRARGAFNGQGLNLSADDAFARLTGLFTFTFDQGWPDLRLSNLSATEGDDLWTGSAASESDGKLIFDLEHSGRQRHIVSSFEPVAPASNPSVAFAR